jgi:hypothetical protein
LVGRTSSLDNTLIAGVGPASVQLRTTAAYADVGASSMPLARWPVAITNCNGDCAFAASAANLQQNLASELKYPPGPAP